MWHEWWYATRRPSGRSGERPRSARNAVSSWVRAPRRAGPLGGVVVADQLEQLGPEHLHHRGARAGGHDDGVAAVGLEGVERGAGHRAPRPRGSPSSTPAGRSTSGRSGTTPSQPLARSTRTVATPTSGSNRSTTQVTNSVTRTEATLRPPAGDTGRRHDERRRRRRLLPHRRRRGAGPRRARRRRGGRLPRPASGVPRPRARGAPPPRRDAASTSRRTRSGPTSSGCSGSRPPCEEALEAHGSFVAMNNDVSQSVAHLHTPRRAPPAQGRAAGLLLAPPALRRRRRDGGHRRPHPRRRQTTIRMTRPRPSTSPPPKRPRLAAPVAQRRPEHGVGVEHVVGTSGRRRAVLDRPEVACPAPRRALLAAERACASAPARAPVRARERALGMHLEEAVLRRGVDGGVDVADLREEVEGLARQPDAEARLRRGVGDGVVVVLDERRAAASGTRTNRVDGCTSRAARSASRRHPSGSPMGMSTPISANSRAIVANDGTTRQPSTRRDDPTAAATVDAGRRRRSLAPNSSRHASRSTMTMSSRRCCSQRVRGRRKSIIHAGASRRTTSARPTSS